MKVQHFFKVGLGVFLLALLVACGQAPLIKPETGQLAPVEAVVPQSEEQLVTSETEATTGSVPIDPADRKFFSPGYGAQPVVPEAVDTLPNIDPADRKFFSPGYRAQPIMPEEADTLPTVLRDKVDPDQDIGLLEFFSPGSGTQPEAADTLPNIDPADRKFFNPGYGAQPVVPETADPLPNIDPADRKFFSPGYGAQPVVPEAADTLPNIDPADRKFFSPGYGAISGGSKKAEVPPTTGVEPQTLAWPPRPTQFRPIVNEAGMQQHDREYGLAKFSNIPELDNDQDMGLMEFSTVPDDTSRQHTEPGTFPALPNIDPADRKFFSPGYGAQTPGAKRSSLIVCSI